MNIICLDYVRYFGQCQIKVNSKLKFENIRNIFENLILPLFLFLKFLKCSLLFANRRMIEGSIALRQWVRQHLSRSINICTNVGWLNGFLMVNNKMPLICLSLHFLRHPYNLIVPLSSYFNFDHFLYFPFVSPTSIYVFRVNIYLGFGLGLGSI